MTTDVDKPRIIYIMGAGRSGTTLLDIILNNSTDCVGCGELTHFVENYGQPVNASSAPHISEFWATFGQQFTDGYRELTPIVRCMERHEYYPMNLLYLTTLGTRARYRKHQRHFFNSLASHCHGKIIIDSSKFSGRALWLLRSKEFDVKVIHLTRSRQDVVNSFRKQSIEQPPKGKLAANVYWLTIQSICAITYLLTPAEKRFRLDYSQLLSSPLKQLGRLEEKFGLDLSEAKDKIENNRPLEVGPVFCGNRIRLQPSVLLKQK